MERYGVEFLRLRKNEKIQTQNIAKLLHIEIIIKFVKQFFVLVAGALLMSTHVQLIDSHEHGNDLATFPYTVSSRAHIHTFTLNSRMKMFVCARTHTNTSWSECRNELTIIIVHTTTA